MIDRRTFISFPVFSIILGSYGFSANAGEITLEEIKKKIAEAESSVTVGEYLKTEQQQAQ